MKFRTLALLLIFAGMISCTNNEPPRPFGPLPSERQLAWHELEYYMFVLLLLILSQIRNGDTATKILRYSILPGSIAGSGRRWQGTQE